MDLSKAFERVDHRILLKKIKNKQVPNFVVNILSSIFENSTASVYFGGSTSAEWSLKQGVRQGGVLSAYLFNIYVDDILCKMSKLKAGCTLGISRVNVLAYADDLVLLAPSVYALQYLINEISTLIHEHKLILNVEKTVIMNFKKRVKYVSGCLKFYYRDFLLKVVDEVKYLGCILSSNLQDDLDIDRSKLSFNRTFGFLFRKFNSVSPDVFYSLFKSYCTDFYGSALWIDRKKCSNNFKNLAISYHCSLKKILNLPKFYSNHFVCDIFNTLTFHHFINKSCCQFLFWLNRCYSPCFSVHRFYFLNSSLYWKKISALMKNNYDIDNVLENDFDAILSRIQYVQNRENRSYYFLTVDY